MYSKYLIAFFVVGIFAFGGFILPTFAQEQEEIPVFDPNAPAQEVEPKVIATVEIYNAEIVEQDGNQLTIQFELYNDQGVQPQVKYAVDLIRETEFEGGQVRQELMDRRPYDEILSLNAGETIQKEITYTAPEELNGTFQLWIVAVNEQSLLLAHNMAGEAELSGDGFSLSVPPRDCKLSIEGEQTFYEKVQGVDIGEDEALRVYCNVENTTESAIEFMPRFANYYRTSFGEQVGDFVFGEAQTLQAGESEEFIFDVPKASEPQSYDFGMTLVGSDGNEELSSTIFAHYVLRGMSGTIQTAHFDKDSYSEGDTAQVFVNWTGRADAFPGSRVAAGQFTEAQLTTQIVNGAGAACSDETTETYSVSENVATIAIPITGDCNDPQINLTLADSEGNVLAQAAFSAETKEKDGIGWNTIIVLAVGLAVLILAGILYRAFHPDEELPGDNMGGSGGAGNNMGNANNAKRNNMKTYALFLPLLFTFGFGLTADVHAITFSVGDDGGEGYYTANLDKSEYEPSETMTISASGRGGWCDNGYQQMELNGRVNSQDREIVENEGYANGFQGCPDDPADGASCSNNNLGDMSKYYDSEQYQVEAAPGDYNARLEGWGANQYEHNSNFAWVKGTRNVPYSVVAIGPSVDLSASPNPVDYNTASTLSWSVEDADSCVASGGWSGSKSASGGDEPTDNLTSDTLFILECTSELGSADDSVTVQVNDPKQCQDGIDNDGDGLVDADDPQCDGGGGGGGYDPTDDSEGVRECSDGIDNDGDGWIDYPNDPGCDSPEDDDEFNEAGEKECVDGINNDPEIDDLIDGNDPACLNANDDNETEEPDFSLTKTNDIEVTIVGGSAQASNETTISADTSETFSSAIDLEVVGISPNIPGIEYNWSENSNLTPSEYENSEGDNLRVTVPGGTSSGQHIITVEGQGGGLTRTIDVVLTIDGRDPRFEEI